MENGGEDLETVAPLVVEYYDWLTDNGGTDPDELLERPLTEKQRRLLLAYMDDVNIVYGFLRAPLTQEAHLEEARRRLRASSPTDEL